MAPSRGIRSLIHASQANVVCQRCTTRSFATASLLLSGHNRWSKIKHDKARTDATKNRQRSIFSKEIALASQQHGPDPKMNPKLADIIAKAKREGFAKASIEAAIARGQGRSASGESLETVTIEGILPNNVAVIVECDTDSKARTLSEVRLIIKNNGGTATPSSYLFTKKGKITFEPKEGSGVDEILEPALDAGATDVTENDDGGLVVWTEPTELRAVGDAMTKAIENQMQSSEVVWDPNEDTKVAVPGEEVASDLASFFDELQEKESSVQSVALNVSQGNIGVEMWKDLQARMHF